MNWLPRAMHLLRDELTKNLLPTSVVSRPLEGEAPTIDLAVGYSKANTSPIRKLFLSRVDQLSSGR
jgi:LysR family transcriptional regulator, hca operon transcriptional activator